MNVQVTLRDLWDAEPVLREPRMVRKILDRMRTGQPPNDGILALTPNANAITAHVGTLLKVLGVDWRPNGAEKPANLFVRGNPGAGKTHLLRYVAAAQAQIGAATAWLETTACQGKLHLVHEWLPSLLDTLDVPLDRARFGWHEALVRLRDGDQRAPAQAWARRRIRSARFGEFADDLLQFLEGNRTVEGRLRGKDIPRSATEHQRRAVLRLAAIADLLSALDVPRLVLLIDQLETMERLVRDIRSRVKIYGLWHDPFMGSMKSTVALWSVVPDQFSVLDRDLYQGRLDEYRDRKHIPGFISAFKSNPWPHAEVPTLSTADCDALARNIVALFVHAHELHGGPRAHQLALRDREISAAISCYKDSDPRLVTSGLVDWLNREFLP